MLHDTSFEKSFEKSLKMSLRKSFKKGVELDSADARPSSPVEQVDVDDDIQQADEGQCVASGCSFT